jgi:hypothetical protein
MLMNTLFRRLLLALASCAVLVGIPAYGKKDKAAKKDKKHKEVVKPARNTEKVINDVYAGVSGFGIPQSDEQKIVERGGAPTYGEILYESEKVLLDELPDYLKENGVFYDFGSGVGKTCVQAYLDYPFKKVVGVELSHKRFSSAEKVKKELEKKDLLEKGRKLEFLNKDFAEIKPKDASVIYMCSTCYSAELMDSLITTFANTLKKGSRVITLKPFAEPVKFGFVEIKEYRLPMTWSKDIGGSPVHVYEYKDPKQGRKQAKLEKKKPKSKKKK